MGIAGCTDLKEETTIEMYEVNNNINKKDMSEHIDIDQLEEIYIKSYGTDLSTLRGIDIVNNISKIKYIRCNNNIYYTIHTTKDNIYTIIVFYKLLRGKLYINGSFVYSTWLNKDDFLNNLKCGSSENDVQDIDSATNIIICRYTNKGIKLARTQHIVGDGYIEIAYNYNNSEYFVDSIKYIESDQVKGILNIDKE